MTSLIFRACFQSLLVIQPFLSLLQPEESTNGPELQVVSPVSSFIHLYSLLHLREQPEVCGETQCEVKPVSTLSTRLPDAGCGNPEQNQAKMPLRMRAGDAAALLRGKAEHWYCCS